MCGEKLIYKMLIKMARDIKTSTFLAERSTNVLDIGYYITSSIDV